MLRQTEVEVGNVPVHPAPAHQSQGAGEGQADATKRRRRESGGLRPVTARSEGRAKPKRDRPPALAAACSRPAHPRQQPRGTSLPRRRRALAPQPPPRWPVRAAACAPGARARALLGCKQTLIARHAGSKTPPPLSAPFFFDWFAAPAHALRMDANAAPVAWCVCVASRHAKAVKDDLRFCAMRARVLPARVVCGCGVRARSCVQHARGRRARARASVARAPWCMARPADARPAVRMLSGASVLTRGGAGDLAACGALAAPGDGSTAASRCWSGAPSRCASPACLGVRLPRAAACGPVRSWAHVAGLGRPMPSAAAPAVAAASCADASRQGDTECVFPLRTDLDLSLLSPLLPPAAREGADGWGAARLEEVCTSELVSPLLPVCHDSKCESR